MAKIILLFLFFLVVNCKVQDFPTKQIKQGRLAGKFLQTEKGRTFSAFTAIPYAKPPVGELRFKSPVAAGSWRGVLDASKSHSVCPQSRRVMGDPNISGNEDCLYLNVYTPLFTHTPGSIRNLPVMIYIHGGFFAWGSGRRESFGPDILLDKDIVLVILNYRLGALGFMSTEDLILPGNNGLKDQSLAIKWVKDNIAAFGGDPHKITIFGQSAGGASAHLHMLSPLSKGNIHRVIAQSGSAFDIWAVSPSGQATRNAKKLAQLLNCPTQSTFQMVACLRKVDAYSIVAQEKEFAKWNWDPFTTFIPVIEPDTEGAFLTENPLEIYISGKVADISFMTGYTTEDGAVKSTGIFANPHLLEELNKNFNRVVPEALLYEDNTLFKDYVSKQIRSFYFGRRQIGNFSRTEVTTMYTDAIFLLAEAAAARLHFKYAKSPVYFYEFGYRSSVSFCDAFGDTSYDYGVCHCDDLLHLLKLGNLSPYKLTKSDKRVTEVMVNLWTNFARTGNPTPTESKLPSTKWTPIGSEKLEYYSIADDKDTHMCDQLHTERINFWKGLPINQICYYNWQQLLL